MTIVFSEFRTKIENDSHKTNIFLFIFAVLFRNKNFMHSLSLSLSNLNIYLSWN